MRGRACRQRHGKEDEDEGRDEPGARAHGRGLPLRIAMTATPMPARPATIPIAPMRTAVPTWACSAAFLASRSEAVGSGTGNSMVELGATSSSVTITFATVYPRIEPANCTLYVPFLVGTTSNVYQPAPLTSFGSIAFATL